MEQTVVISFRLKIETDLEPNEAAEVIVSELTLSANEGNKTVTHLGVHIKVLHTEIIEAI